MHMPSKTTAQSEELPPDSPQEGDYEAFCETLASSARGRAFLAEYTRRNRNADTEQLLAAIARLQTTVAAGTAPVANASIKANLRALLDEIATAQGELDASIAGIRAARLAELVALIERRIVEIMTSAHEETAQQPNAETVETASSRESADAPTRTHLVVVPIPEQPELPIPSPIVTQPPPITLVRSETIMAEVVFAEPPPAPPALSADVALPAVEVEVPKIEATIPAPAQATPPARPANPLASIMALKEEERLALFT